MGKKRIIYTYYFNQSTAGISYLKKIARKFQIKLKPATKAIESHEIEKALALVILISKGEENLDDLSSTFTLKKWNKLKLKVIIIHGEKNLDSDIFPSRTKNIYTLRRKSKNVLFKLERILFTNEANSSQETTNEEEVKIPYSKTERIILLFLILYYSPNKNMDYKFNRENDETSTKKLCERLKISTKTLYRDIAILQQSTGFTITHDDTLGYNFNRYNLSEFNATNKILSDVHQKLVSRKKTPSDRILCHINRLCWVILNMKKHHFNPATYIKHYQINKRTYFRDLALLKKHIDTI